MLLMVAERGSLTRSLLCTTPANTIYCRWWLEDASTTKRQQNRKSDDSDSTIYSNIKRRNPPSPKDHSSYRRRTTAFAPLPPKPATPSANEQAGQPTPASISPSQLSARRRSSPCTTMQARQVHLRSSNPGQNSRPEDPAWRCRIHIPSSDGSSLL